MVAGSFSYGEIVDRICMLDDKECLTYINSIISSEIRTGDNLIKALFTDKSDYNAELKRIWPEKLLKALNLMITTLNQEYQDIVMAIVGWSSVWTQSEGIYAAYVEFLQNLVSAHSYYVVPTLKVLVKNLRFQEILAEKSEEEMEELYERVHFCIKALLPIIPSMPKYLSAVLREFFPYKKQCISSQEWYLRNLIKLISYIPMLRASVLELVVEKIISIDVEVQVEMDEISDEDWDKIQAYFNEDNSMEVDEDFDASDCESICGEEKSDPKYVKETIEKLDLMMFFMFEYFEKEQGRNKAKSLFYALLGVFERVILSTFKSRYTQFLVFYICSFDPEFPDIFLGMLVSRLIDSSPSSFSKHSIITKAAIAAYIGSFVSRAKFLSETSILSCLDVLVNYCEDYVCRNGNEEKPLSADAIFYSASQAIFYIICFHHQLILSKSSLKLKSFLERIIFSKLNPLRACQSAVAEEFSKIMKESEFLYCFSILEKNKKYLCAENDLDSFFPFDPYNLKLSRVFIDSSLYREWQQEDVEDEEMEAPTTPPCSFQLNHLDTIPRIRKYK